MSVSTFPVNSAFQWISLSIIIVLFLFKFVKRMRFVSHFSQFKGPKAYPVFGNVFNLKGKDTTEFFKYISDLCALYKEPFILWIGPNPKVYIFNPDITQTILSSSEHISKSPEYALLHDWLGTGLVTSSGAKWHRRRKILTPAFHYNILESMLEPIQKISQILVNQLRKEVNKKEFNVCPYTKLAGLDVLCATTMGYDMRAQENMNLSYVNAVERVSHISMERFMFPWLQNEFIFKKTSKGREYFNHLQVIHQFTLSVIKERRNFLKTQEETKSVISEDDSEQKITSKAFLDLCLQLEELTDENVREEVDTFMFAGHDTTSTTASFTLYALSHRPEMQEKIVKEAESVGFYDGKLTMQTLSSMEFLERCIKESLRLYPPVPVIARQLYAPLKTPDLTIEAGVSLFIHVYEQHRNPEYFPDPHSYNPDRFLTKLKHPYAYVPFSAGPRNCIGQKVAMLNQKILLATILKRYTIHSTTKPEDLNLTQNIVLENKGGLNISIRER